MKNGQFKLTNHELFQSCSEEKADKLFALFLAIVSTVFCVLCALSQIL